MKRKILTLLCLVAIVAIALASCEFLPSTGQGGTDATCDHTKSDKWSASSTQHWHAATCEHNDLKFNVATHTDVDEDGKCDVCEYALGHTHNYSTAWTSDSTHHWKSAICTHKDEKTELSAHADENFDGYCDACSYHVHVEGIFGYCTVCGEQLSDTDAENLDEIIPLIVESADKISGGAIIYNYYSTSPTLGDYVSTDKTITYDLGKGYAYYCTETSSYNLGISTSDKVEKWFERLGSETVFGVYKEYYGSSDSGFVLDPSATLNNLTGYYYSISTLADAYGAEKALETLYNLSFSSAASNYLYGYEDGTYSFSYGYLYVNTQTGAGEDNHVDYYEVSVSFTISETGALTGLKIVCDCYSNSLENEVDNDFTYNQPTNSITMKETAIPDTYTFVVTQTEGERTYVSEHKKSDFIPESFDFYTDSALTVKLGSSVKVTEATTLKIYLGNFYPAGTSADYIVDTFSSSTDLYTWIFGGTISIYCRTVGSYPVEISLGGKTVSFTVIVEKASSSGTDEPPKPANGIRVEITGAGTYAWDTEVSFTALASGDYTFTVPAGLGAYSAADKELYGNAMIDPLDPTNPDGKLGGSITVSLLAGETYVFYTTAIDPIVTYVTYSVSDYTGDYSGALSPEAPTKIPVTVGDHTLTVTEGDISKEIIQLFLEVDEEGTYSFVSDSFFANIYDSKGNLVSRNVSYLTEGSYTFSVYVGALQSAGEYLFSITYTSPDDENGGSGSGSGSSGNGSAGSYENPIEIDSIPTDITLAAGSDNYYSFTATEDCVIIITGGYASVMDYEMATEYDDDFNPLYYTVYGVSAGDVVILNIWNTGASEITVNITTGAPVISGSIDKPLELAIYGGNYVSYPIATADGLVWFYLDSWMDGELTLSFNLGVNVKYGSDLSALAAANGVTELKLAIEDGVKYYFAIATADGSAAELDFTATLGEASGTDPNPKPDPDPDPKPNPGTTGLEGKFKATCVFNDSVRVLVDSTTINIVDPEGRVITFTYTYVDGIFEVWYKENKLTNTVDPVFTITDGTLTAIRNNGTDFTLTPTDEEIEINKGNNAPEGTEPNPHVIDGDVVSIVITSDTNVKTYYKFTATTSGTVTLTWPTADSWVDIYELDSSGNNTANSSSTYLTTTFSFEIEAGKTYRLGLGTANKKGEFTILVTWP